jgi:hypothetical protein
MPKKLKLNKEYIFQRAKEGATANKIAKELNCCQPTISKFFKENNLSMKCIKNFKGDLPEEEIIYKYKVLKISPEKIRKDYGCSASPIYNILKKNSVVSKFNGYLVKEYCKKYGFSKRSVQRWISEGKLPHIIENRLRVIPFEKGDEFAISYNKSHLVDIDQLLRLHSFGRYTKKELSILFNIPTSKVKKILNQNIRNFGLSGNSPVEFNYNLDI